MTEPDDDDVDVEDDADASDVDERRACACGCWESEHDPSTGRCLSCPECVGFRFDEEATIDAQLFEILEGYD